MKCADSVSDPFAYWLRGSVLHRKCGRVATHRVRVNPPNATNDGTKLVCELCAPRWYAFQSERLTDPT
jgi:hypothetical protein